MTTDFIQNLIPNLLGKQVESVVKSNVQDDMVEDAFFKLLNGIEKDYEAQKTNSPKNYMDYDKNDSVKNTAKKAYNHNSDVKNDGFVKKNSSDVKEAVFDKSAVDKDKNLENKSEKVVDNSLDTNSKNKKQNDLKTENHSKDEAVSDELKSSKDDIDGGEGVLHNELSAVEAIAKEAVENVIAMNVQDVAEATKTLSESVVQAKEVVEPVNIGNIVSADNLRSDKQLQVVKAEVALTSKITGVNTETANLLNNSEVLANKMVSGSTNDIQLQGRVENVEMATELEQVENLQSPISNGSSVEQILSGVEIVEENDLLVKVDESVLVDDLNVEQVVKTDKLSQDMLDDMDVTVRSVEKQLPNHTFDSSTQNQRNGNGANTSAQESIIKMSIESVSDKTANISANFMQSLEQVVTKNVDAPAPKEIRPTEILNQINSKITLPQENTSSKVNIILKPENLGRVNIEIINTKDGITAKMIAETPQVKEILDKNIDSLKNSIASQGVSVSNISVKVEQSSSAQNSNLGYNNEQFNQQEAKEFANNGGQKENRETKNDSEFLMGSNNSVIESEEDGLQEVAQKTSEEKEIIHEGLINVTV